jgi:hypothetical protein
MVAARLLAHGDSALIQIGSKHGTPLTVHLAGVGGGVMVNMSRDRDWLDRTADVSEILERAATSPASVLALLPDGIGELRSENVAPSIWDAINDLMSLSRSLAGELHGPENPKVCPFCSTTNPPDLESCQACGTRFVEG